MSRVGSQHVGTPFPIHSLYVNPNSTYRRNKSRMEARNTQKPSLYQIIPTFPSTFPPNRTPPAHTFYLCVAHLPQTPLLLLPLLLILLFSPKNLSIKTASNTMSDDVALKKMVAKVVAKEGRDRARLEEMRFRLYNEGAEWSGRATLHTQRLSELRVLLNQAPTLHTSSERGGRSNGSLLLCDTCGGPATYVFNLRKCGNCHAVAYCGERCQLFSWPHHRKSCGKPVVEEAPPKRSDSAISRDARSKLAVFAANESLTRFLIDYSRERMLTLADEFLQRMKVVRQYAEILQTFAPPGPNEISYGLIPADGVDPIGDDCLYVNRRKICLPSVNMTIVTGRRYSTVRRDSAAARLVAQRHNTKPSSTQPTILPIPAENPKTPQKVSDSSTPPTQQLNAQQLTYPLFSPNSKKRCETPMIVRNGETEEHNNTTKEASDDGSVGTISSLNLSEQGTPLRMRTRAATFHDFDASDEEADGGSPRKTLPDIDSDADSENPMLLNTTYANVVFHAFHLGEITALLTAAAAIAVHATAEPPTPPSSPPPAMSPQDKLKLTLKGVIAFSTYGSPLASTAPSSTFLQKEEEAEVEVAPPAASHDASHTSALSSSEASEVHEQLVSASSAVSSLASLRAVVNSHINPPKEEKKEVEVSDSDGSASVASLPSPPSSRTTSMLLQRNTVVERQSIAHGNVSSLLERRRQSVKTMANANGVTIATGRDSATSPSSSVPSEEELNSSHVLGSLRGVRVRGHVGLKTSTSFASSGSMPKDEEIAELGASRKVLGKIGEDKGSADGAVAGGGGGAAAGAGRVASPPTRQRLPPAVISPTSEALRTLRAGGSAVPAALRPIQRKS